jgi:hypothetical protein
MLTVFEVEQQRIDLGRVSPLMQPIRDLEDVKEKFVSKSVMPVVEPSNQRLAKSPINLIFGERSPW